MDCSPGSERQIELFSEIRAYISRAKGLKASVLGEASLTVIQAIDQKTLEIRATDLENVLLRSDTEGQEFIQVNFLSGKKLLLTSNLIGFKPVPLKGLDLTKLPKVVTTPDILNVYEAIQDSLESDDSNQEFALLKRVFEAVLAGGEAVGFDLSEEKSWLTRLTHVSFRATAS